MAEASGDLKTIVTIGEAVAFLQSNPRLSGSALAEKILEESRLSLAPISCDEQKQNFADLKELLRKRCGKLRSELC